MKYIITRTNGKVVQVWQNNRASWEFFLNRMSRDVQWKNETDKFNEPWLFKLRTEAEWYLSERRRCLSARAYEHDQEWSYEIREVEG